MKDGVRYDNKKGRLIEHNGRSHRIYWTKQMLSDIKRMYPTTLNEELAGILGVSQRTLIRKARELGLEKNSQWLLQVWEQHRRMANLASMVKGYPGTFKKGNMIGFEYRFKPKNQKQNVSSMQ